MPRVGGSNPGYILRFCREVEEEVIGPRGGKKKVKHLEPTESGIDLPSVTTIVKAVWGNSFTQAAYWGYNIALDGFAHEYEQDPEARVRFKAFLKEAGFDPNQVRNQAAERGTRAHGVLEALCADEAPPTELEDGYSQAAVKFYNEIAKGKVVQSERLVFNLDLGYCGTCDLALRIGGSFVEVCDAKTHAPSSAKQAAYNEDRIQVAAYAVAFEWMWGTTINDGSVVLFQEDGTYIWERFQMDTYKKLWYNTLEAYKTLYGKGKIT